MSSSSSRIAYLGVEMMGKNPGDCLGDLLFQVDQLKNKGMKAWFVDIVHDAKQTPEAIWLEGEIFKRLEQIVPWQTFGSEAINIKLNINNGKYTQYRAEQAMKKTIEEHRKLGLAENVNFKDQDGRSLPLEY